METRGSYNNNLHNQNSSLNYRHHQESSSSPPPLPRPNNGRDLSQTLGRDPGHQDRDLDPDLESRARILEDSVIVRYKECLKNHAASMGGHVVDGCGEFMPSGEPGMPEALKCAACDCHRNFHRKEISGEPSPPGPRNTSYFPIFNHHQTLAHHYPRQGSGGPGESSSEDLNNNVGPGGGHVAMMSRASGSKKRFRTKFTQEQKDKMHEFAEKIGWRIQKQEEQQVMQFCNEVGVKRKVFKVWMHNNKQSSSSKKATEI